MNKLEKLIAELCPNGVEYKALGEVCYYSTDRINASEVDEQTYVSVESLLPERTGRIVSSSLPKEGRLIAYDVGDVLIGNIRPYLKKIWLADMAGGTNGDVLVVKRKNDKEISSGFLYHLLSSDDFFAYDMQYSKGAKMPRGDKSAILKYVIPLPPLPVQEEIVRMLDDMAGLIGELEQELDARKQQYEWYRERLVKNGNGVKCKALKDIAIDFYRGNGILRTQVTSEGVPCVRYGEIYTDYDVWFDKCISHTRPKNIASLKYFEYGDVLFSITGEKVSEIGKSTVYVGNEKCLAGGDIVVMKHTQNPKYIGYALSTVDAQLQKSKGKVKSKVVHLSVSELKEIVIPVPPLSVQEEVVQMLDNMTGLLRELEQEISARKQQYEYYRDKLLTFPRAD